MSRKRPEGQGSLPFKLKPGSGKGRYTPWPERGYHGARSDSAAVDKGERDEPNGAKENGNSAQEDGGGDDPV